MTSYIISAHANRAPPPPWNDENCPFCKIVSGELPCFKIFENDSVIAILDIMPLRRGHVLVIPKHHEKRLSELPVDVAEATGAAVTKVAKALTIALENTGLNVVCNQEYAQAVPHVHFHIIPAPNFSAAAAPSKPLEPLTRREMHRREFEARDGLDEDEAVDLANLIKAKL